MTWGAHHWRSNLTLKSGWRRILAVGLEDDFVNAAGFREALPVAADNICGVSGVADVELCLDEGGHVVEVLNKISAEADLFAQFLFLKREELV